MREFVGHKIQVTVEGKGDVEGVLVNDSKVFLFLKEADGHIHRYAKGKVCGFVPLDFEPLDYVPFHLLRCWNKKMGCPGVRFIQEGSGVKSTDFEAFMGPCECRDDSCEYGTKGEIRTVEGKFLREVFQDVLFGEYPERKGAGDGKGTATEIGGDTGGGSGPGLDEEAGGGEDEGGRDGEAEVAADWGA